MSTTVPGQVTLPAPREGLPYGVIFVCTGNICRSPMAEIITRALAAEKTLADGTVLDSHLALSSAGTGPWHEGEPMHDKTAASLSRGGFADHPHVARQFPTPHMARFDLIVALDRRHQQTLRGLGASPDRLILLRAFDPAAGAAADVPDPYYADADVFDQCRDMITAACRGLVDTLANDWTALAAAENTRPS